MFSKFDADDDGRLETDELRRLLKDPPPTLELIIRIGRKAESLRMVEVVASAEKTSVAVRRSAGGLVSIVVDDVQIEIGESSSDSETARQSLLSQFANADRDNNNYLDEKEVERYRVFVASFDEFDRDGDGKIFEQELTAAIDNQTEAAQSRIRMAVHNRGRDLFEVIDADHNGRLSRREFSQAAARIELWDNNADGEVSEAEVPQLYQISLGPGQPVFRGLRISAPGSMGIAQGVSKRKGPKWFRRMDRNQDGEIAWREFFGTRSEFGKIDRNSDGAIDPLEAEKLKPKQ